MTIAYLPPNAEGDYTTWNQRTGTSKWANMSDASDTTAVSYNFVGGKQSFFFDYSGLPGAVFVQEVGFYCRSKLESGTSSSGKPYARLKNADGTAGSDIVNAVSFAWYTRDTLARPGGGTWAYSDIVGDFELVIETTTNDANFFMAEHYAKITYAPQGGFVFFLSTILPIAGPLATFTATDWLRFRASISSIFTDAEWKSGVREMLAYRAPRYAML